MSDGFDVPTLGARMRANAAYRESHRRDVHEIVGLHPPEPPKNAQEARERLFTFAMTPRDREEIVAWLEAAWEAGNRQPYPANLNHNPFDADRP